MPDLTGPVPEAKMARQLAKMLNGISVDVNWLAATFVSEQGTAMQNRAYDLCLSFIRHWAMRKRTGSIKNSQVLYPICVQCDTMLRALENS